MGSAAISDTFHEKSGHRFESARHTAPCDHANLSFQLGGVGAGGLHLVMKSEKTKMAAGELYNAADPELTRDRVRCREICQQFNATVGDDLAEMAALLAELLGRTTDAFITPPFHCDYGTNIRLGEKVYFNFNCVVLDVLPVTIGDHTLIGPAVQIYTATHPLDADERRRGLEAGAPVTIGNNVWIGGSAIICPGVTIGDRSVIGAGSVVTRSIPADVVAAGNPCRVIRSLKN